MINQDTPPPSSSKPKFGIGQMMFLIAWLGLFFGLIRASLSTPPRVSGRCSEIAVSDSGEHTAAVYFQKIHLFRNGRYVDQLKMGQVDSIKFIDDETLVIVSLDGTLPRGVHYYSLAQKEITSSVPLSPKLDTRVILLEDKFLVHQLDKQLVGEFHVYEMNESAESTPVSSHPSPTTNMPFDATNDGRYIAFHFRSGLTFNFDSYDSMGYTLDCDLKTGKSTNALKISNGLAFSPDGSSVITCRSEITKFEWPSGEKLWSIPSDELCGQVRISRGGEKFAVVTGSRYEGDDRHLRIYATESAKKLFEIELSENGLGYAFSTDGQSVLTADPEKRGVVTQWDIASGSIVKQLGSANRISSIAFYVLLFFLWSVLYVRLFPSRFVLPYKRGTNVAMLLNSGFILAMGCYSAFQSSSLTMVLLSGATIIICGNGLLVLYLRSLLGSVPKESDTDSA